MIEFVQLKSNELKSFLNEISTDYHMIKEGELEVYQNYFSLVKHMKVIR